MDDITQPDPPPLRPPSATRNASRDLFAQSGPARPGSGATDAAMVGDDAADGTAPDAWAPGSFAATEDSPADAEALLRLALLGGPARPRRALLLRCGGPQRALSAPPGLWREVGASPAQLLALRRGPDPARLARGLDWLAQPGHRALGWHHTDYPGLLRRIASPPPVLFVAGDAGLLWHPAVAVVGSRGATAGGRDHAANFAHALATAGFCVVSGMAAGIDRAAHEAALALPDGRTVAVLGTGPDVPYPSNHAGLHTAIVRRGAVVSEHPPGTGPRREHFPTRNRILAGLALGTLVVEAALRSGALITARLAAEAGREVFAMPGAIHNPMSRGCHRLIRDGAGLVETAEEVIAGLGPWAAVLARDLLAHPHGPSSRGAGAIPTDRPRPALRAGEAGRIATGDGTGDDHDRLWQALGYDPTDMDGLAKRSGLTAATLSSMLLLLELEGRIVVEHGRYSRRPPGQAPGVGECGS